MNMEEKKEAQQQNTLISSYPIFFLLTLGYALFYTACLYQNGSGITFPLFTAGTMVYFGQSLKLLGVRFKRDSIWYMAAVELLGVSTFLTGDPAVIALNKLGIFLLLICFLLHMVYEDREWDFTKYTGAFFMTVILSFSCIHRPVTDGAAYWNIQDDRKRRRLNGQLRYVLLGGAIGIPIVLLVLFLLAGADAVFADFFARFFAAESVGVVVWNVIKMIVLAVCVFFGAYMLLAYLNLREIKETVSKRAVYEPAVAITITLLLSVIYVFFCGIQIRYLFAGGTLPDGLSYSAYARKGFFQLLFVCILNLVLVLFGMYRFRESRILKGLLCLITGCTFVIIASSAIRMLLYIQYQYLTFLRIFVLWSLAVITLIFAGVMIGIWKKEFPLFRYSLMVVTVSYLLFSFSRPSYWVAKVNTDNMRTETQYDFFHNVPVYDDVDYLSGVLNSDAAPVIMDEEAVEEYAGWNRKAYEEWYDSQSMYFYDTQEELEAACKEKLEENWKNVYIARMEDEVEHMGIRSFNLSGYRVRTLLGK